MKRLHQAWWALGIVACVAMAACGDEPLECGSGTVLKGGKCVVEAGAPTCGAGTVLQEGSCVPDPDAIVADKDVAAVDAGTTDSGATDAGATDSGATDAGATDAGATDSGATDAGATDGGPAADTGDVGLAADATLVVCLPHCVAKECGTDGCGGSCGTCKSSSKPACDPLLGVCVAKCESVCGGKNCGPDGCGGLCGLCADTMTCSTGGRCIPPQWTCPDAAYGDGNTCDCTCGAPDADCADAKLPVKRCAPGNTCDKAGKCVSSIPASWTCSPLAYASGHLCDCGCGAVDPDCSIAALPVHGCPAAGSCNKDGTCPTCVPQCQGKTCGDDGCGGQCGLCNDAKKPACIDGKCADSCKPKPMLCAYNACGPDGCGGSCGTCGKDFECVSGDCQPTVKAPDPTSCSGHCGSQAPAGCHCQPGCVADKTCCADYKAVCTCKPDCGARKCGDDGCGGSCGTCSAPAPSCGDDGQCTNKCVPFCDGRTCGSDGCGGTCGNCAKDATCAESGHCVPTSWHCSVHAFADKAGCDCGCGAVDPDCKDSKAVVFGCPTAKTKCGGNGVCDVKFCTADSACNADQVCSGAYYQSKARFAGVCAGPVAGGLQAGADCEAHAGCSSQLCIAGHCATHCGKDTDCPTGLNCLARPLSLGKALSISGFTGVCQKVNGTAKACAKQADCAATGETCVALVDATTLQARHVCSSPDFALAPGEACPSSGCGDGLFCVGSANGPVCTRPCPGGAADCPSGWTCGTTALHNAGTHASGDDPKVTVCRAK